MQKSKSFLILVVALLLGAVFYFQMKPSPQELVQDYLEETLKIHNVDFPTVRFDPEKNTFSGVYGGNGEDGEEAQFSGFTCFLNAERTEVITCNFGE